jgi:hypothetical protein
MSTRLVVYFCRTTLGPAKATCEDTFGLARKAPLGNTGLQTARLSHHSVPAVLSSHRKP